MRLRDLKESALPGSARVLCLVLRERGLLDADPRDYAAVTGGELVTFFGEYRVTSRLDGRLVDPSNAEGDGAVDPLRGTVLLHRRDLWRVLGVEEARRFWRYGRRTRR